MVLEFPVLADYCILQEGSNLIFATHGHTHNISNLPPLKPGDILLHGHTHIPACEEHNNIIYMNPGSTSIPKENSPHSYMTLENGTFLWKDIEGNIYNEYKFTGSVANLLL